MAFVCFNNGKVTEMWWSNDGIWGTLEWKGSGKNKENNIQDKKEMLYLLLDHWAVQLK